MNFYGIRELSNNTKAVLATVSAGNRVIITENGKPTAIMLKITEDTFEETLVLAQQLEARQAVESLPAGPAVNFSKGLSAEEFQAEIDAPRKAE